MKYYIHIEETRTVAVEVEASSEDEALVKVENAYNENMINLDRVECITDTDFEDETGNYTDMINRGYPVNFIKLD